MGVRCFVFSVYDSSTLDPMENRAEPPSDDKAKPFDSSVIINRTRLQPCDRVITLYTLYPPIKNKTVYRIPAHGCERYITFFKKKTFLFRARDRKIESMFLVCRPFVVLPIPSSNLILLVVDNICPVANPHYKITTAPYEQEYSNESLPCYRSTINLRRRRPPSCINRHVNVSIFLNIILKNVYMREILSEES